MISLNQIRDYLSPARLKPSPYKIRSQENPRLTRFFKRQLVTAQSESDLNPSFGKKELETRRKEFHRDLSNFIKHLDKSQDEDFFLDQVDLFRTNAAGLKLHGGDPIEKLLHSEDREIVENTLFLLDRTGFKLVSTFADALFKNCTHADLLRDYLDKLDPERLKQKLRDSLFFPSQEWQLGIIEQVLKRDDADDIINYVQRLAFSELRTEEEQVIADPNKFDMVQHIKSKDKDKYISLYLSFIKASAGSMSFTPLAHLFRNLRNSTEFRSITKLMVELYPKEAAPFLENFINDFEPDINNSGLSNFVPALNALYTLDQNRASNFLLNKIKQSNNYLKLSLMINAYLRHGGDTKVIIDSIVDDVKAGRPSYILLSLAETKQDLKTDSYRSIFSRVPNLFEALTKLERETSRPQLHDKFIKKIGHIELADWSITEAAEGEKHLLANADDFMLKLGSVAEITKHAIKHPEKDQHYQNLKNKVSSYLAKHGVT